MLRWYSRGASAAVCSCSSNMFPSMAAACAIDTSGPHSYLNGEQVRGISKGSSSSDVNPVILQEIKKRITTNYDKTVAAYTQKKHIRSLINFYASMKFINVNLTNIVVWMDNPNYDPYIFSHRQLPVLLAHLVISLEKLPGGLSSMSNIAATKSMLVESFTKLLDLPIPTTLATEKHFADVLEELDNKHSEFSILIKMAVGVMELKSHLVRHKQAISMINARRVPSSKLPPEQAAGIVIPSDFHLSSGYDKQSLVRNDSKPDFEDELLMIQEPIDEFNKMLIQYNFVSRQLIDFAQRVEENKVRDEENSKSTTTGKSNQVPSGRKANSKSDVKCCMNTPRPDFKMSQQVGLKEVLKDAIEDARHICDGQYGDSPDVVYEFLSDPIVSAIRKANMSAIVGTQRKSSGHLVTGSKELQWDGRGVVSSGSDGSLIYAHIAPTVHYIVVELMKNAFRATIEKHMKKNASGMLTCSDMPPVKVIMNARQGLEHSCICVSDRGHGIKRSDMQLVMSYSFSTANNVLESSAFNGNPSNIHPLGSSSQPSGDGSMQSTDTSSDASPMEGYGYGLPMSRAYARSFGGDLLVQSVEGYGTKVSLYLQAC